MNPSAILFRISEIRLSLDEDESLLKKKAAERLGIPPDFILSMEIVRKSLDARKKNRITFVFTVEMEVGEEAASLIVPDVVGVSRVAAKTFESNSRLRTDVRPVIAGAGPAGLFAALRLAEHGLRSIILERGRKIGERVKDVERFWKEGVLDAESNVQFGEGGAGTFSDGKLTTRVDDRRMSYILKVFADAGADADILYLAKPHIGTDRLRMVITNLRRILAEKGCEFRFGAKVTGFDIHNGRIRSVIVNESEEVTADLLVLATGHSARDTYEELNGSGVEMIAKPFAVGLRVEHPQELIDSIQYGPCSGHPRLPASEYILTHNFKESRRSVYSFCMCPGGQVISASSESGRLVINGMSLSGRDSGYANSALVATVTPEDFDGGALGGIAFQRRWEEAAFMEGGGNYSAPARNLMEFADPKRRYPLKVSTYRPGLKNADLGRCLPDFVIDSLREVLPVFDRKMRGFLTDEATIMGVETRTSAPVRILRGQDLQSVNVGGLYPCGEGAGYAGGIMSSALDGIRVADMIACGFNQD